MITGDRLQLGHDSSRHAAYVDFWIQSLKDDPRKIYRASQDAQGMSDYLLDRTREKVPERESQPVERRAPAEGSVSLARGKARTTEAVPAGGRGSEPLAAAVLAEGFRPRPSRARGGPHGRSPRRPPRGGRARTCHDSDPGRLRQGQCRAESPDHSRRWLARSIGQRCRLVQAFWGS